MMSSVDQSRNTRNVKVCVWYIKRHSTLLVTSNGEPLIVQNIVRNAPSEVTYSFWESGNFSLKHYFVMPAPCRFLRATVQNVRHNPTDHSGWSIIFYYGGRHIFSDPLCPMYHNAWLFSTTHQVGLPLIRSDIPHDVWPVISNRPLHQVTLMVTDPLNSRSDDGSQWLILSNNSPSTSYLSNRPLCSTRNVKQTITFRQIIIGNPFCPTNYFTDTCCRQTISS